MGSMIIFMFQSNLNVQGQDTGFRYMPLPDGILIDDPEVIDGWRTSGNIEAMRSHAWAIWRGMTTTSGQPFNDIELPIWDTWYSGYDVFDIGPPASSDSGLAHEFESLTQLSGQHVPVQNSAQSIMGFNKFNFDYANHVWSNEYYLQSTLTELQSTCDPLSTEICSIAQFPSTSIGMKPVFWLVAQNAITVLPVWEGIFPGETTTWQLDDSSGVGPETWLQCVAIDKTGQYQVGDIVEVTPIPGTTACNEAEVVSIDEFYHFTLNDDEYDQLQNSGQAQTTPLTNGTIYPAAAGDELIFIASHITTRELPQWVWMTIWWSQAVDDNPVIWPPSFDSTQEVINNDLMYPNYPGSGVDRPDDITEPWDNYVMCTNYGFVSPAQPLTGGSNQNTFPEICFNPYLEAGFSQTDVGPGPVSSNPGGGINTNCTTCHGQGTWNWNPNWISDQQPHPRNIPLPYISAEYVSRDDPRFAGFLQTEFTWSIPVRAQANESD